MHFSLRSDADLNLGCPQDTAREEHFGAYLLGKKDWPLVQNIGEQNINVPEKAAFRHF
jgi:hypothetical protein